MSKRFQVFVSSTYEDLRVERQQVMQALLELDCIPAGMELFPAADDDQWTLIRSVIDECDYYIVIVGARYGSVNRNGISYTEMEYRYALQKKKPIIGFLLDDNATPSSPLREKSRDKKKKLEDFRSLVGRKLCKFWSSPVDLGSQVSRSITQLIKAKPAIGWVRADSIDQLTALESENAQLRAQLQEAMNQVTEQKGPRRASKRASMGSAEHGTDPKHVKPEPERTRMPVTAGSIRHKFDVAGHEGYLHVGLHQDGAPGELFVTMAKEGSTVGGMMDAFATAISLCLQYGVPLEALVKKFSHQRFDPQGMTRNPDIPFAKSIVDYIFRWLGLTFIEEFRRANLPGRPVASLADAPACDVCGASMVQYGASYKCLTCGTTGGNSSQAKTNSETSSPGRKPPAAKRTVQVSKTSKAAKHRLPEHPIRVGAVSQV